MNKTRIRLRYIILLILFINLIYLGMVSSGITQFYSQSATSQIINYKENIPANALVVVDRRIFRGTIHWQFYNTNYLESSQFIYLMDELSKISKNRVQIPTYYVECAIDDCGWGTIKDQPEFNNTMEALTMQFANLSTLEKEIFEINREKDYIPFISKPEKNLVYRVYKTTLLVDPLILELTKQTHTFFLYPIGYDRTISEIFDDYAVNGFFNRFIYRVAWIITYLAIFLALFSLLYLVLLFLEEV